ncbi:MAG: adenosine deaminase [Candidatus Bipolaricaulia bacterium]
MRWIQRLPKAELHCHLDGSLRPETIWELAQASGFELPVSSRQEIDALLKLPERIPLNEYLNFFRYTVGVLQTEDALERVARELCEDTAAENVKYLEVRFAPMLHRERGLSSEEIVESVLRGLTQGEAATGIKTGLILCCMRDQRPELSEQVARLACVYHGRGVVALDIAGPEQGYPAEPHRKAFEIAQESGLHITIHAGEACCPEHIESAIELGADRIGHGIHLFQDEQLEYQVAEHGIALEVCPTSNLQTAAFIQAYLDHPIMRYHERGIPVTVNTDNRLMSHTTMTDELCHIKRAFDLSVETIEEIIMNGVRAAFLDEPEHQELVAEFQQALARIDIRRGRNSEGVK